MEPKKISFGFSKLSKKTNIVSNIVKPDDKKVELIECLEGQSIKVKDAVEEVKQPLIIPIKDNQKNLLDRIKGAKRSRPQDVKNSEPEDNRPDSELTVDELAARQLIREAKARLVQGKNINESKVSVLPLHQEALSLEGEKEPTLEDYESVPIGDYGLALLRGMGWKEGMTVGRNTSKTVSVNAPELRPKGLGLGATKVVQAEMPTKKPVDKDGKELILVKGAYAKIIAGVKKGNYCEVQGFDDEAGRVIVKVYPQGDNLNVNEFMLIPVTKEEFAKGSRILNNAKYEEYLEISEKNLEKYRTKPEPFKSESGKEQESESDSKQHNNSRTINKKYSKDTKSSPIIISDDQRDGHTTNRYKFQSSDSEYETEKKSRNHTKSKYRDKSRSRSSSRHKSKKEKDRKRSDYSSDSEYAKEKKDKHTKSKYRDRGQDESGSREKHKKDRKHKSKNRRDSSSESDSKRDKRKKNKCKSRHRRNSSSSSTDRKGYRSKK